MSTEAPTTRYVSPDGDDGNDGLSWSTPFQTIFAAYQSLPIDGGTIYIADHSWVGGPIPNQGIWIVGPSDPDFEDTDPEVDGWLTQKYRVRFIGVGSGGANLVQFARPGAAHVRAGRPSDSPQGWVADQPAIWVTGTDQNLRFENLNFDAIHVGARLGISRDKSNRDRLTGLIDFENVNFVYPGDTEDLGRGPTVDAGYAFWITWRQCAVFSYAKAPLGDDRRAAMLLKADGRAPGLWIVDDCHFAGGGGVKYDVRSTGTIWGGMTVTDCIGEDGPSDPIFWVLAPNPPGSAANCYISNVGQADADVGSDACVKVSPWLSPDVVVATNASSVSGPATLIGTSYPFSGSMGSNRQVGLVGSNPSGSFALGHAVTDRRAASPFSTRFTPLQLSAAPAYNATGYPPTSSGTMTVTEIDGPLGPQARLPAYRLSTTKSPGPESKDGLNIGIPFVGTNAVDDLWIVGMWMRAPNSTVYLDGPSMVLGSNPPYVTLDLSENSYYIREPSFDQAWQWVTFATRITAVSDNPALMMLSAWVYADYPLDIYQPTVYRLPAGTYDASDAMEWAQRIVPVPAGATPGNAVLLPGQNLEFGTNAGVSGPQVTCGLAPPTAGTWSPGSIVFNAAPDVGRPAGWVCVVAGSPGTWVPMANVGGDGPPMVDLAVWLQAGTLTGTDGSAVGTWADSSPNGHDATQSTTSLRPVLKTGSNGINGRNVVRFDGVDDYLSGTFPPGSTGINFYAVIRTGGSVASSPAWLGSGNTATAGIRWGLGAGSVSGEGLGWAGPAAGTDLGTFSGISANTTYLVSYRKDLSQWKIKAGSVTATVSDTSFPTGTFTYVLGAEFASNWFFPGDIAEVLVYTAPLSDAADALVQAYLKTKYGLS